MKRILLDLLLSWLFAFPLFSNDLELTKLPQAINTDQDEYPCGVFDNKLLFIRKDNNQATFSALSTLVSNYQEISPFNLPKEYKEFKGSYFSYFETMDSKFIIFSGRAKKKFENDLFIIKQDKKSNKYSLTTFPFNSQFFDSHPQFDPAGKFLVFSSENPNQNNTDIFVSRFENGSFEEPKPIDVVNTNANEITPFLDENGNLYFARFDSTNYNIYKAEKKGELIWDKPRKLPYPINTEANELAPVVFNNKLFFASDRSNENHNFDVFVSNLCLPVILEVNFKESLTLFSSFDKLLITENNGTIIDEKYLGDESQISFTLQPNKNYQIKIKNECTHQEYFSKNIKTLCLDTIYVKYVIPLEITGDLTKEKNIRFFLTGYYRPITKRNLTQLKKLFDYNLIANDDSTNYIEYPQPFFFDISDTIENALKDVSEFISYFAKMYQTGCMPKNKRLKIEVIGYADPRPLSPNARFFEETISDPYLNFYLSKGSPMTNQTLSKLRAYFTAKEIIDILSTDDNNEFLKNAVAWDIVGGGTIDEEEDYLLLRKVKIKIFFERTDF